MENKGLEGYGIYENGKLQAWLPSIDEANWYKLEGLGGHGVISPLTIHTTDKEASEGNTNSNEIKELTKKEWLERNPLKRYMRSKGMGWLGVAAIFIHGISVLRLQKLAVGIEEPTLAEYLLIAGVIGIGLGQLRDQWEQWLASVPEHVLEGGN